MLLWGFSSVFQGVYVLVQKINVPLMVQPQLFGFLCLVSWGQCQYYGRQRSKKLVLLLTLAVMAFSGILELVLVLVLRRIPASREATRDGVLKAMGILASVLIAVALFPQYYEIYKHKAVIGISLLFMGIDMLGGVLNDLSLVFKEEFDVVAAAQYTVVVVLDGVIVAIWAWFKVRDWRLRRKAVVDVVAQEGTRMETGADEPP